jgi:hypothetical protein
MNEYTPAQHEQCARILEKLPLAAAADPNLEVFGARKHQYKLGQTLSAEQIEEFETHIGVELPSDYKAFLTMVGNGGPGDCEDGPGQCWGAGPYYGLIGINDEWIHNFCENECMKVDLSPSLENRPCRHVVVLAQRLRILLSSEVPKQLVDTEQKRLQKAVDGIFDDGRSHPVEGPDDPLVVKVCELATEDDHAHFRRECIHYPETVQKDMPYPSDDDTFCYDGLLPLCEQGCSYMTALVLNGPYHGRVVNIDSEMCSQPLFLHEPNFLDYYERWLDEVIAGYHFKVEGEPLL